MIGWKMCYFGGWGNQTKRVRKTRYEVVDKDVNDLHLKLNNSMDLCNGGKWLEGTGVQK